MPGNPRELIGLALSGNVLEIGPGSRPFAVAPDAKISYADRSVEGGRDANWPELIGAPTGVQAQYDLNLDTDGLSAIDSAALDGVVASHVIEHVANPLAALKEFSRVLRPGGKLLLVVPDRQHTFDAPRVPTAFSTVQAKFKAGAIEVDEQSIREFCEAIYAQPPMHPPQVRDWHDPHKLDAERLALHRRRSIHVHCWSPEEFASLITASMLEISVSWTLIDMYCADHFPNGQANEFALLLQKVPEPSAADAAQAFVQRWTDLSLRDERINPSRLVNFHLALTRDLGEMALSFNAYPLDASARQHQKLKTAFLTAPGTQAGGLDLLGQNAMMLLDEPGFLKDLDSGAVTIRTALSPNDKTSFLRVQRLARRTLGEYAYLEIGSEQGASLQPYLLDPACLSAVSIDLRPPAQPDERGILFHHIDNSTARMRETLTREVGSQAIAKLVTFDSDAAGVAASELPGLVDVAMIDAEHTNTACFSDFLNVLRYVKPNSVIAFHDANLILDAIQNAEQMLRYLGIPFATVFLPDCVAAIGLRDMAEPVRRLLGPHAHVRERYIEKSKRELQKMVGLALIDAGEFPHLCEKATPDTAVALANAQRDAAMQERQTLDEKFRLLQQELASSASCVGYETQRADAAAARVAALEGSTSWKITAPLRALVKAVRGR